MKYSNGRDVEKARISRRKHYQKNKESYLQRVSSRREEAKKFLEDIKSKLKCEECGESHPATLDFHHRDPSQKSFSVSALPFRAASNKTILDEVAKCITLCSNCHRILHYNERNLKGIDVTVA